MYQVLHHEALSAAAGEQAGGVRSYCIKKPS